MAENERNTKNSVISSKNGSKNVVKFERTLTLYGGIALTVGTMIGSGQGSLSKVSDRRQNLL